MKTLRGLDSMESGQRYLDGWTITYNHMRGHESLKNDTPGERAKANPPFTEWADVVKEGAVFPQLIQAETRLADAPQLKSDVKIEMKPAPPPRLKRESVSDTPRRAKVAVKPTPVKATTKIKRRSAKQHPYYKLRQRVRRTQKGRK